MRRMRLAAVILIGAAVIGSSCTAVPPQGSSPVQFSTSADRSDAVPLDGATVSGAIHVFVERELVQEVAFRVDAPFSSAPTHVERSAPYDLAGTLEGGAARPWDTSALTPGEHVVRVRIVYRTGEEEELTATFTAGGGTGEEPSAWQQVLDRIGPDGRFDLDAALAAFVLAFGPLPGVPEPPGPRTERPDGSGPLRWLLGHWDELTPDQHSAIERRVGGAVPVDTGPVDTGPVATAPATSSPTATSRAKAVTQAPCSFDGQGHVADPSIQTDAVDLAHLAAAQRRLTSKLGFELRTRLFLCVNADEVAIDGDPALAYTLSRDEQSGLSGPAASCVITINPSARRGDLAATIAHELVHCYQAQIPTDLATYYRLPSWRIEGWATWAESALTVSNEAAHSWWITYLVETQPLVVRTYDAVGFYGQLAGVTGGSGWSYPELLELAGSDDDAFTAVGATNETFMDTWASARYRLPELGSAWDLVPQNDVVAAGNVPPPDQAAAAPRLIEINDRADRSAAVTTYTASMLLLQSSAFAVRVDYPEGAHLRAVTPINEGPQHEIIDPPNSFVLCTTPSGVCECPDNAGESEFLEFAPMGYIAHNGGIGVGQSRDMTFSGLSKAEACGCPDAPAPETLRASSAADATCEPDTPRRGGSNGDPHLTTFDGLRYDFQAAGEFVLAESTTDDFAVQARQVKAGGGASTNGALAVRVGGHRVAFYSTVAASNINVLLDGVAVATTSGITQLPGGGTFERLGRDLAVVAPDGSRVDVHPISAYGLRAEVSLAPARFGSMRGLLGDGDGTATGDLRSRDGTIITPPFSHQALYRTFGDTWRVTAATSLFDYAVGQSTDTFTDLAYPTEIVGVDDLDPTTTSRAERTCRAKGVEDLDLLAACILDVGLTGLDVFADAAVAEQALDVQGALTIDGPPARITVNTAGAASSLTFQGTIGQRVAVLVPESGLVDFDCGDTVGGVLQGSVRLVSPAGDRLGYTCSLFGSGGLIEPVDLPTTGEYSVVLDPEDPGVGSVLVRLISVVDQVGAITLDGPPVAATVPTIGARSRFRFSLASRQTVFVSIPSTDIPDDEFASYRCVWSIDGANGIPVARGCAKSGRASVEPTTLPAGNYEIVFDPYDEMTGVSTMQLFTVGPPTVGSIVKDGPAQVVTVDGPGEVADLAFTGATGERVVATVTGATIPDGCGVLQILDAQDDEVGTACIAGGTATLAVTLPFAGIHRVRVDPELSGVGSATVRLMSG